MPIRIMLLTLFLAIAPVVRAGQAAVAVTESEGVEDYAVFSPDGRTLAYAASEVGDVFGGNWDVWTLDLESGRRRNLTPSHDGDDRFPSFSPDGQRIAYWSDRDGGVYRIVTIDGSELQRLVTSDTFASGPAGWSPDGESVSVIVRRRATLVLETVSLGSAGSAPRRLPLDGKSTRRFDLSPSPDGRLFAYVDASSLTAHVSQLFVLDASTGTSVAITDGWTHDWSPSWSPDGKTLYWVSNRGGKKDLWRQSLDRGRPMGEPKAVTEEMGIRHASVSPDGTQIAYSLGQTVASIWRVPILADRLAVWDDAEVVVDDDAHVEFIALSPDGGKLVTTSDTSGNPDLWLIDLETKTQNQLTEHPTPDWGPAFSPDGRSIGFYAFRSGNRDLWSLPTSGGPASRLTDHPDADMYPVFSPDGSEIVFYSVRSGNRDLWVIPSSGGQPRQLTTHTGDDLFPDWSPDGKWIVFNSNRGGTGRIWAVRPDGSETTALTQGPGRFPRFSHDGSRVFFTGWAERLGNLFAVEFETGSEKRLTDFTGRPGNLGSYVLAADDRFLYFAWETNLGDLFLAPVP